MMDLSTGTVVTTLITIATVACFTQFVQAAYRDKIPNGNHPEPPYNLSTWPGNTNKHTDDCFDEDLKEGNYNWTLICKLDSDGDRVTNGQELGDPYCAWTSKSGQNKYRARSHPGICEPPNSTHCLRVDQLACNNKTWVPPTEPTTVPPGADDEHMKFVIIGVVAGLIIFVLIVILICICYNKT